MRALIIASNRYAMWPWVVASATAHAALLASVIYIYSDAGSSVTTPLSGVEVMLISAADGQQLETKPSVAQIEPAVHPPVKILSSPVPKQVASESMRTDASLKKAPVRVTHAVNSLSEKSVLQNEGQASPPPSSKAIAENTASAMHEQGADAVSSDDHSVRNKLSVRKRLERYKYYPASARRRGIEGAVDVSFRLNADGRAEQMRLLSGSGYSILDNAALSTVRRAEPFPVREGFYRFRLLFTRS